MISNCMCGHAESPLSLFRHNQSSYVSSYNLVQGKVSRTWIKYNKPGEPNAVHAGLLFGLGLQGYLHVLNLSDIYQYFTQVCFWLRFPLSYLFPFPLVNNSLILSWVEHQVTLACDWSYYKFYPFTSLGLAHVICSCDHICGFEETWNNQCNIGLLYLREISFPCLPHLIIVVVWSLSSKLERWNNFIFGYTKVHFSV